MARKQELKRGAWSKDEVRKLRKLFGTQRTEDVAWSLNRGVDAVKKKASRLGLVKTQKYLKSLGRTR